MKLFKLICLCLCVFIGSLAAEVDERIAELTVKGSGTIQKPADQLEINIAVVTENTDAQKAVQENNAKMNKVLNQLKDLGLGSPEMQTGQYAILPVYHYPEPKEGQASPHITHYEVINALYVKTKQLNLAEKIIGVSAQSGANRLDQVVFSLSDPQVSRQEVIQLATQRAIEDAQSLAQAAGVKLVRVLNLELDPAQEYFHAPRMMAAKVENLGSFEAPLEIGQVDVQASVHMVFEIVN